MVCQDVGVSKLDEKQLDLLDRVSAAAKETEKVDTRLRQAILAAREWGCSTRAIADATGGMISHETVRRIGA